MGRLGRQRVEQMFSVERESAGVRRCTLKCGAVPLLLISKALLSGLN
jgi:hypothetical protein